MEFEEGLGAAGRHCVRRDVFGKCIYSHNNYAKSYLRKGGYPERGDPGGIGFENQQVEVGQEEDVVDPIETPGDKVERRAFIRGQRPRGNITPEIEDQFAKNVASGLYEDFHRNEADRLPKPVRRQMAQAFLDRTVNRAERVSKRGYRMVVVPHDEISQADNIMITERVFNRPPNRARGGQLGFSTLDGPQNDFLFPIKRGDQVQRQNAITSSTPEEREEARNMLDMSQEELDRDFPARPQGQPETFDITIAGTPFDSISQWAQNFAGMQEGPTLKTVNRLLDLIPGVGQKIREFSEKKLLELGRKTAYKQSGELRGTINNINDRGAKIGIIGGNSQGGAAAVHAGAMVATLDPTAAIKVIPTNHAIQKHPQNPENPDELPYDSMEGGRILHSDENKAQLLNVNALADAASGEAFDSGGYPYGDTVIHNRGRTFNQVTRHLSAASLGNPQAVENLTNEVKNHIQERQRRNDMFNLKQNRDHQPVFLSGEEKNEFLNKSEEEQNAALNEQKGMEVKSGERVNDAAIRLGTFPQPDEHTSFLQRTKADVMDHFYRLHAGEVSRHLGASAAGAFGAATVGDIVDKGLDAVGDKLGIGFLDPQSEGGQDVKSLVEGTAFNYAADAAVRKLQGIRAFESAARPGFLPKKFNPLTGISALSGAALGLGIGKGLQALGVKDQDTQDIVGGGLQGVTEPFVNKLIDVTARKVAGRSGSSPTDTPTGSTEGDGESKTNADAEADEGTQLLEGGGGDAATEAAGSSAATDTGASFLTDAVADAALGAEFGPGGILMGGLAGLIGGSVSMLIDHVFGEKKKKKKESETVPISYAPSMAGQDIDASEFFSGGRSNPGAFMG